MVGPTNGITPVPIPAATVEPTALPNLTVEPTPNGTYPWVVPTVTETPIPTVYPVALQTTEPIPTVATVEPTATPEPTWTGREIWVTPEPRDTFAPTRTLIQPAITGLTVNTSAPKNTTAITNLTIPATQPPVQPQPMKSLDFTIPGIVVLIAAAGVGLYLRRMMQEETDQVEDEEGETAA
jgi:hypothetical protein